MDLTKIPLFPSFLFLTLSFSLAGKKDVPKDLETKISYHTVTFTENKGQIGDQYYKPRADVLFSGTANGLNYHLRHDGVFYQLSRIDSWKEEENLKFGGKTKMPDQVTIYQLDVNWPGSNQNATILKDKALPGYNNYYTAVCPNGVQNVKTYTGLTYKNIYKNIDLHYYEKDGQLKYDYLGTAGADYKQIALEIVGAKQTSINTNGELVIETPLGNIVEQAPVVKQGGKTVPSRWVLNDDGSNIIHFEIDNLNPNEAFIIDPVVRRDWSTFYGGNNADEAYSCATDATGNVLMAGYSNSTGSNIIATPGSHQFSLQGSSDGFLVKFDLTGQRLWGTFFGGSDYERAYAVCTDALSNIFITGYTGSNLNGGITTPGCHQPSFGGANEDAFIAKFDSTGARKWSTYYGGFNSDIGTTCTVDAFGDLYVGGYTGANNGTSIATAGGYQTTRAGLTDAFLVKFNTAGQRQWGTYYGDASTQTTQGFGCATDASGNVYLCGKTGQGATTLSTPGSHQPTYGGGTSDGFLVKFNSSGVRMWATFYGGSSPDQVLGCCTDISDNVYLCGFSSSANAISSPGGHQLTYGGTEDGFLVKFDENGLRQWSTYYGGPYSDKSYACFSDYLGNIYMSGINTSPGTNVIATAGSQQTTEGGGGYYDAYLAKFNSNGQRQWGSYYGGSANDFGAGCAGDDFGNLYMAGYTGSSSGPFLVTAGAHQTTFGGSDDAFLEKFFECPPMEPVSTTPPNNLNICENETTVLTVIGSKDISWFADATGGTALSTGSSFLSPALSAGSYTYYAESRSCSPSQTSASRTAITVNVDVCTGIVNLNGNGKQEINVYPNPVCGEFYVLVGAPGSIVITNLLGQVILEGKISSGKNAINLNDHKKGVYFLHVITGSHSGDYKIVKD